MKLARARQRPFDLLYMVSALTFWRLSSNDANK